LDEIIEELHTYENALQTMGKSIGDISTIVKTNEGKSIEAWDHDLTTSKDEIKNYQKQVSDLLSLFENYVIDTTAYISPLARGTMMRVSRNDIWANLQQINTGFSGNVADALVTTYKQPNSFLFGLLDDPSDAEQDASDHNRIQLEGIQENIQSSQSVLEEKMEGLMGLYNQKVKPFENTDDAYKDLATDVKKKYTSFFEGVKELLETMDQIQIDLVKGFVNGLIGLVAGVATIAWDVGVVSVSAIIPDPIEPTFLRNKADETFDEYKEAAIQLVQDPMSVVELVAQTVNDTIEHEGIPYLTGETLTAFIPASMGVKVVKGASKLKGPGKTNVGEAKGDAKSNGGKEAEGIANVSDADKARLDGWEYRPSNEHYLKHKQIYDNPKYYNQETGVINWPLNDGFEGSSVSAILEKDMYVDRYGGPQGSFLSPEGTPYGKRSLALHSDKADYYVYEVLRPIEVSSGKISPWFGREGGGIQYIKYGEKGKPYTINELIDEGYIKLILKETGGG